METSGSTPEIIIIAHNIRSTLNVGAIFRTAEGFGVKQIILSGYTPYPRMSGDTRLPHVAEKITKQIHKTALGAGSLVLFTHNETIPLKELRQGGYTIVGLEQDERSITISKYVRPMKIALLLGEEVDGIAADIRKQCDTLIEIPMHGQKESFNVSVATGIALYALTTQA